MCNRAGSYLAETPSPARLFFALLWIAPGTALLHKGVLFK